jgi:carboxyl-terminal processing protease
VIPVGATTPIEYPITRAKIELKDSEARGEIVEQAGGPGGGNYKVGVIDLPSFYMDMEGARRRIPDYKSTTRDVKKILDDFQAKGVDAVVMDLRRNGGGSLTEAISLTGLFIDEGPVVQVKGADGEVQHYDDLERGTAWNGPLVVLVSKLSASASEIFAGAIQDYGRGLVIGDPSTHGKGTVQTLREVGQELFEGPNSPQLGALKITMQKFYRPSGDSTQNRGVLSDIELPSLTSHLDIGESDLDYAMEFDRVPPSPYRKMNYTDGAMLGQLRDLSKRRTEQSEDFKKVTDNIDKYEKQKKRKTVDLNEEKFLAERKELNADKEEEKQFEEMQKDRPVVTRDYYFNEALAITADYLRIFRIAQAN